MLHNTGHYGPNEAPINMGTPVNMTPISGHMNITHNINNLSKIAHQGVPTPSGQYNLPDYAHYNHSPLGIPPQMSEFPSYPQLGFQQSYMNQNANNMNDLPFPNSMFPMNLNIQNEHHANMMNYAYDKRVIDSVRPEHFKDQNMRKMPLNIPQIPNKMYNKEIDGNNDFLRNNMYEETQHNLDLSMKTQEKLQINSTRRKNIENTVKLIEDILIHSSNKPKEVPQVIPMVENTTIVDLPSDLTVENVIQTSTHVPDSNTDPLADSPQPVTVDNSNMDIDEPDPTQPDNRETQKVEKGILPEDEEITPVGITQHFITEDAEVTTDNSIVIKVEKASWADSECYTPFLKDSNGFERDEHMHYRIIEGDSSVEEAVSSYKNGNYHF